MASPRPVRHERFYSEAAKRWAMDPIRNTVLLWFANPDKIINMAGGLPTTDAMPFKKMDVTLKDGTHFSVEGPSMSTACQYGPTSGCPETVKLFRDIVLRLHSPPTASVSPEQGGLDVMVTTGSTEGGSRTMELLLNTGDYLLAEDSVWSSTLQSAQALGLRVLAVQTDHQGIIPSSLRQTLSQWSTEDALNPESDIPKVLITTPHASNPTGATVTLDRRKEIYQICREYDIIIIEDDPYYFLLFDHDPLPSYLSMDEDGRVIRLDSFSKVLAPGFRCGIISGSGPFLRKIMYNLSAAHSHPNTLAQILYVELFKKWGFDGFMRQVRSNCALYKKRRDVLVAAAHKYLKGLVQFDVPAGGMFVWMKVHGFEDTKDMANRMAPEKGILVLPGAYFRAVDETSPYIRVSFAYPTPEDADKGIQRLSEVIKEALEERKHN